MQATKVKSVKALQDHIIVSDMNFEFRTTEAGIVLPSDDMKTTGVRPRWGRVYAVGAKQKDVKVGQWICVSHGRWTRGAKIQLPDGEELTIRRVDIQDILLVSDEKPLDLTIAD
jgi:co-chaperonin GroES (HSP10)